MEKYVVTKSNKFGEVICGVKFDFEGCCFLIGGPAKYREKYYMILEDYIQCSENEIVQETISGNRVKILVFADQELLRKGLEKMEADFLMRKVKGFRRLMN